MIIAILGRQSKLGLAELESLTNKNNIKPLGANAALLDVDRKTINGQHLGGVTRLAVPIAQLNTNNWQDIIKSTIKLIPKIINNLPDGKIKLGLSVYGFDIDNRKLSACGLELKKVCKNLGRSARLVPNTGPELNSAQVLRNKLTSELGVELLIIKHGATAWLAKSYWVQDIDAYSLRDFGRPKRDAFVGMLPPKLAQIMLNLAKVKPGETVLDPFCGTGVVLQEAALMRCKIYGSDISEKMVTYSKLNLNWLAEKNNICQPLLETADATSHVWKKPVDHIVCETYLGQPLSGRPSPEKIREVSEVCNKIITKFLQNAGSQLPGNRRFCIAVPAWRVNDSFYHLKLLDHLEDLGYNRVRFQHASETDLIYYRKDQIVARELLVITTK